MEPRHFPAGGGMPGVTGRDARPLEGVEEAELFRRAFPEPFRSAADVFDRYRFLLSESPVEVFVVVLLDVKHRPLREERVSAGILDGSPLHPRGALPPGGP